MARLAAPVNMALRRRPFPRFSAKGLKRQPLSAMLARIMSFTPLDIDRLENTGLEPLTHAGIMRLNPGARVIKTRVLGPFYSNRFSQVGPDVTVGKYFGMNEHCFVA